VRPNPQSEIQNPKFLFVGPVSGESRGGFFVVPCGAGAYAPSIRRIRQHTLPQRRAKRFWSAAASAAALYTLPLRPPCLSTAKAETEVSRTPKALRAANPPHSSARFPFTPRKTFVYFLNENH